MQHRSLIANLFLLAVILKPAVGAASEVPFPQKPISLVVGYPVGGGTDLFARVLAEKLEPRIGQPVVVINKPGATGIISASFVSRAKPDGYTLLLTPGSLPYAQQVLNLKSYDPLKGFTPIIHLANVPIFLVTGARSKFKNVQEVLKKSETETINYATAGTGSIHHIIGEIVNNESGAKLEHVPYKGVAPAISDLLGGHIPLAYLSLETALPYIPEGKVRVLAVSDRERSVFAPDVPSFSELGYNVNVNTWYGIFGPKGVPTAIVSSLNKNLNEILMMPDVIKTMATLGAIPVGGKPESLDKLNAEDYYRFEKIIKDLKIQGQ